ncbi:LOW QUALITY PROTEIN: ataxin-7-like protein 2 [Eudromia elegans]
MAARGRAAAAAAERRLPSPDGFAGQSWSAWVERAGPPAEPGLELEESGKSGSKKLDTMTLIKEDMSIFGHCPAHDDFYLVVCNHCSQVVKPQAFQKHCERRHGPLSAVPARAGAGGAKGPALNGRPPGRAAREKAPGGRAQPLPDKDNLCLFVPVVNLEKIPSLPKADGHGVKVPPKASPAPPSCGSKELSPGKPSSSSSVAAPGPKEPAAAARAAGAPVPPQSAPAAGEREPGAAKPPAKCPKKLARKECDLNRQCGVLNPDTRKVCTRLLTCKIHSVHQRREVRGRAKDFDVLVAELKASARKADGARERSPPRGEPPPERLGAPAARSPSPGASPCGATALPLASPHSCALPGALRSRLSSGSDVEEAPPAASGQGPAGLSPLPPATGGSRASSDESDEEEDAARPDCPYGSRPPRPQAFCTFGSRLVSPGCYVFNRRLDRFCSALGSMLERHLSSHMWRRIPPAADPQLPAGTVPAGAAAAGTVPAGAAAAPPLPARPPPACPASGGAREARPPASLSCTGGSPVAAAACSQPEGPGGGGQGITSPLPANTPSPSFSKLPAGKASGAGKAKGAAGAGGAAAARKKKQPPGAGPPCKRTCPADPAEGSHPPGRTKLSPGCPSSSSPSSSSAPSSSSSSSCSLSSSSSCSLNGSVAPGSRVKRAGPLDCRAAGRPAAPPPPRPPPPPRAAPPKASRPASPPPGPPALAVTCVGAAEATKRKNAATSCRPGKGRAPPGLPAPAPPGCPVRRKKLGAPPAFEEKRGALKSKAH